MHDVIGGVGERAGCDSISAFEPIQESDMFVGHLCRCIEHMLCNSYGVLYRFERVKAQHARFDDAKHETLKKRFFLFSRCDE